MTKAQAQTLAHKWIAAFNDHDLETILSHYAESVELTSLLVTKVLGDPAGTVRGKQALRAYFAKALAAAPETEIRSPRCFRRRELGGRLSSEQRARAPSRGQ